MCLYQRLLFIPFVFLLVSLNLHSASPLYAAPSELFFSEYIEGSSNNKALEIYNGTGTAVNLSSYTISFYFNGSIEAGTIINLTGTVADGDVFVLADVDADSNILAEADQTDAANFYNGDDVIILTKGGTTIDVFGQFGEDPGTQWGGGDTGAQNNTLRRKGAVCAGDTNDSDAFDPVAEWDGFGEDETDDLGSYTASCDGVEPPVADVLINELDADTPSTDTAEFVELYGATSASLDGLALVFFDGGDDASYRAIDLDGQSTNASGYFVACIDATKIANCDLDVGGSNGMLQNGPDAVALYEADGADFPNNTPVTAVNLIDAIVYDTNDADDSGLLDVLTAGKPQVNEAAGGDVTGDSNQRCPNGSGGAFETAVYTQAEPTPGETNLCEIVTGPVSCADTLTFTPIYTIQGSGMTSTLTGSVVDVEAVVTGDFQNNGNADNGDLNGFYIQGESDSNSATSDGIFVFHSDTDVEVGDLVRVRGTVEEFETSGGASSLTEIGDIQGVAVCSSGQSLPAAVDVTFPLTSTDMMEQYEGMLVNFPQELVISEYFNFDRFNEIVITNPIDGWERPLQPTAYEEPGAAALAIEEELERNRITLDDGRTSQNSVPARHPNGLNFSSANLFRGGDMLKDTVGIIDDSFGLYRIQPTAGATHIASNPRPATPESVGGSMKVVSVNALNYFLTIDDGVNDVCGGNQNLECRGADSVSEFERQRTKLLAALLALDADIIGIVEIENTPGVEPLADLVSGMNAEAGAGTYSYIDTGVIGTDAIKVGFIYKTTTVEPVGNYAILDSSVDPTYLSNKNRPALAQTFEEISSNERLTVAVNHFKSKGSSCNDVGDPNAGEGQGNCNGVRTDAATALAGWLATDPTGSGDPDMMIIGDLNAYDKEDPIDALKAAGYTDLAFRYNGEDAYSYVFDGQFGYLDYILVNGSLLPQVTGLTEWHINADEPDIWSYDESFNDSSFFEENAYRFSDHDPIIAGLGLNETIADLMEMVYLPIVLGND